MTTLNEKDVNNADMDIYPTHWMPLPSPPSPYDTLPADVEPGEEHWSGR